MNKTLKRTFSVLLALLMLVSLGTTALAEGELAVVPINAPVAVAADTAAIQVNGELISFPSGTPPYYDAEMGRVFVPFRDLFTALGAEVEYDTATGTAIATREDVTVAYVLGDNTFEVLIGDIAQVFSLDVLPVNIDGRVLVPVRFFAEAVGVNVGWDSNARTVLVADAYLLNKKYAATYETVGLLTELFAVNEGKTLETHSELDFTYTDLYWDYSLPITATLDAITSPKAIDAKLNIKADLAGMMGDIFPGADFEVKYNIDAEIIINLETGFFALKSDKLLEIAKESLGIELAPAGSWLTLDASELASALVDPNAETITDVNEVFDLITEITVANAYLYNVYSFEYIEEEIALMRTVLTDESFKKSGNNYVSTLNYSADEDSGVKLVTTIKCNAAGKATALTMSFELYDTYYEYEANATLEFTPSASSFTLTFTEEDYAKLSIKETATTKETTKTPRSEIPKGAKSVKIEDILAPILYGSSISDFSFKR